MLTNKDLEQIKNIISSGERPGVFNSLMRSNSQKSVLQYNLIRNLASLKIDDESSFLIGDIASEEMIAGE